MWRSTRICFLLHFLLLLCVASFSSRVSFAAEATTAWRIEWEKTVKAAEEEGALVIYMAQSLEPVFRDSFQKKFPKIKVTMATERGPEISQQVMSERRGKISPKEKVREWARQVKGAKFLSRSGLHRRAGCDSRHHQKGFDGRGRGKVNGISYSWTSPGHQAVVRQRRLKRRIETTARKTSLRSEAFFQ